MRYGCSYGARDCGPKNFGRSGAGPLRHRSQATALAPLAGARLDPRHLVFLDEAGIKANMAPLGDGGRRASGYGLFRRTGSGAR